jgi:hypothetical protein
MNTEPVRPGPVWLVGLPMYQFNLHLRHSNDCRNQPHCLVGTAAEPQVSSQSRNRIMEVVFNSISFVVLQILFSAEGAATE